MSNKETIADWRVRQTKMQDPDADALFSAYYGAESLALSRASIHIPELYTVRELPRIIDSEEHFFSCSLLQITLVLKNSLTILLT